jgi:Tfp pilus assembly protein PilZ
VTDLGEGGAFLDTATPQPAGTLLQFRLELPDDPEPIEGTAQVAWQQPMLGMGIEFLELEEKQKEQLRFFVGSVFFGGGDGAEE